MGHDIRRMASAWVNLGLKQSDVFAVLSPNSYQVLVTLISGISIGAIAYGITSTDSFRE